jgi:Family of unknown function (DUF6527)
MGQVSPFLRRTARGYSHWCPGCEQMHVIFDRWSFDGNLTCPTFDPSVRITGKLTVEVEGEWTGEWVRDAEGKTVDFVCHYFLRAGVLEFCGDSTHAFKGRNVPLPELPVFVRDDT